jgi:protein-tyrosine phosphatase
VTPGRSPSAKPTLAVLFVCMGNICRSPTAEALFRRLAPSLAPELNFEIDSAGTHDYHLGAPPDERSLRAALDQGIDMSDLRARRLVAKDFEHFDWIIVMDERNRRDAQALARPDSPARLVRLLDFAPGQPLRDVPDPYYGGAADFAKAIGLIETGIRGLIAELRAKAATH